MKLAIGLLTYNETIQNAIKKGISRYVILSKLTRCWSWNLLKGYHETCSRVIMKLFRMELPFTKSVSWTINGSNIYLYQVHIATGDNWKVCQSLTKTPLCMMKTEVGLCQTGVEVLGFIGLSSLGFTGNNRTKRVLGDTQSMYRNFTPEADFFSMKKACLSAWRCTSSLDKSSYR